MPRVVRTYAPSGQTPILREWYTHEHLSAIGAISPEGKLYFHCQDHALNSADVVAFLEHLLREVPGRLVLIWDGTPSHRSYVIKAFLADGAARRHELAIEQWRVQVWPELKKKARMEGRTIVFVEESGFYLLPRLVRTYAPGAQTPVLRSVYARDHVSVMSGITMQGRLSIMVRRETLDSLDSTVFLHHLRLHVSDKLLVMWDGSPIHTGYVNTCLAEGGAKQIHVEQLPPYAPDLNPDEGVWHYLKHVEMRNLWCLNLTHLRTALGLTIRRLRRKPHLITACFAEARLSLEI